MSNDRRKFMKIFGGAFGAAAALLSGRDLLATGDELSSEATPSTFPDYPIVPKDMLWSTAKFNDNKLKTTDNVTKPPMILRIAYPSSVWCRKGLAQPGLWMAHEYESKECTQLGQSLVCERIEFAGVKAMRFRGFEHGVAPVAVSTDPKSELFQDIMYNIEIGPQYGSEYDLYGPIYKIWPLNGKQEVHHETFADYEFFCGNRSLRHFAHHELGYEGVPDLCRLGIKILKHPRMGFMWHAPTLYVPTLSDPIRSTYEEAKAEIYRKVHGG